MSKLAALAAKRRQKEKEKPLTVGRDELESRVHQTFTSVGPDRFQTARHELLEKASVDEGSGMRNWDRTDDFRPSTSSPNTERSEPQPPSVKVGAESIQPCKSMDPPTAVPATPSPFAATIMAQDSAALDIESGIANYFASAMSFNGPYAKPFDFIDPSPDDVVTKAQRSKGSN